MIARLRRGLAALLAFALVAWSAPAFAEPALWVVKDADSTIYLFGTVHYLRPELKWRSDKIDQALKASQELVLEVPDLDGDPAALQPLVMRYGLDREHPLSTKIKPADEPRLAAAAQAMGVPRPALEPMQPWLVALTFSVLPAVKAGYDPKSGVELSLMADAKAAGHPVSGLETMEQQIRFLAEMPPAAQVSFLSSTLDDIDDSVRQIDALVTAWQAGDMKALEKEFVVETRRDYPELYQVLLVRRNQAWAQQLREKLAGKGVTFVAVGAGHLVGPDSVQEQLKKLGVKVERQ